jgi:hypothetical protein
MKFIHYLNENETSPEKIVSILREECAPILKWMSKHRYNRFLRRFGHSLGRTEFDLIIPRKDRKPSDTPLWVHKLLDQAFNKKFGVKARSSGVFCRKVVIQEFTFPISGEAYAIFPVGDYKYLWAPDINDLYLEWTKNIEDVENKENIKIRTKSWAEDIVKQYTDKDLDKAYSEEIMLLCDKYYAISGEIYESVWNELKK